MSRFSYRTLKPALFFGYTILPDGIKLAFMEKAILDYFYLNPSVKTVDDFYELRINVGEMWSQIENERLEDFVSRFDNKRLSNTIKNFISWSRDAGS